MEDEKNQSGFVSFFAKINIFRSMAGKDILGEAIKKIIYVLVVLVPIWFLPITINVLELNKQALIVLLSVIALILWFVKMLNTGELKVKKNIIGLALGAFLLIAILSTIFSIRPYGSLVGSVNNLSLSLINIICFVTLIFLIVNNFKGAKETFGLLFAFLFSAAIACVYGFIQMWGGFIFSWDFAKTAAFNTIGSINTFGIFSAVILTMLSALLFVVKRPAIKVFFGLFAILNLITLISINFWTLWIVLAAGMFVVLLFSLMYIAKLGKGVNWIALPMVLLGISLIFIFFRPSLSFKPTLPTEVGLNSRGSLSVIYSALKEKPILGSGPEMFSFDYAKYKPSTINETAFWNVKFSNPTGEIYSLVSGFGILGALSFLAILILFVINAIKNITREKEEDILKKFLDVSILAGWFGILVSWFLYPQSITLTFVFWLLLALYLIDNSAKEETVYSLRKTPKVLLLSSLCFVVAIVIIIGMLYVAGTRYVADIMYAKGVNLVQVKGEVDNGINAIVKSTVVNPYDDNSYKALSQLFTIKLQQDASNTTATKEEVANLVQADAINAINSATRTTVLSPKDASNWLLRGQVYRGLISVIDGAADWAETSYNEAIKLEPSNPFAYLEIGRLYENKADAIVAKARTDAAVKKTWDEYIAKAMENIDKSIALKSNYSEAYFEQAQIYDRQGKLSEAIKGMEINRQLLPSDSSIAFQLAVLYYRSEMFKEAQAEFIRAIGIDPNFSNARYFLGLLYDWEGNKQLALEQFNKIAELNKDNQEIQTIISNINTGKPALGKPISAKKPSELLIDQQPVNQ